MTCPLLRPASLRAVRGPLQLARSPGLAAVRLQLDGLDGPFGSGGAESPFSSASGGAPPSEKQVAYAQALSLRTQLPIPPEALDDAASCSDFINAALERVPPTEKQVAFAMELASKAGQEMPEAVLESSAACSAYIDEHLKAQGGEGGGGGSSYGGASSRLAGAPSQKQLLYAAALAVRHRVGLSFEVLSSKVRHATASPRRRQQPHPQPAPSSASGGLLRLHRPALAGGAARLAAAARGRTGATRHPPTPIRALGPDAASLANRRRRERHRCFETRTFRSERFGRAPLRPRRQRRRLWRRWPTKRAASAGDARTDQIQ